MVASGKESDLEEGDKSVRPSVNAKLKPEQTLLVGGPLTLSILLIAVGAIAGWGWLVAVGILAMAASAIWSITASMTIMRNRRKKFYRGFDERSSFGDFMKGK